jgi:hypothetical protein
VNEIFFALKMELHLPKSKILEQYINRLPFGNMIYGIADASVIQWQLGKSVGDTLKYKDDSGNYRVITPFDLNGGAAWFNSMDVIVSLRKLESNTEWYTWKVRKQHLAGKTGEFHNITFDMNKYRFEFDNTDPFNN